MNPKPAVIMTGTKPIRIQRQRVKGWRLPENTVIVTRPSALGNPFQVYQVHKEFFAIQVSIRAKAKVKEVFESDFKGKFWETKAEGIAAAVEGFRRYATEDPEFNYLVKGMQGLNVCCFCKPGSPCHGDVILEIANPG